VDERRLETELGLELVHRGDERLDGPLGGIASRFSAFGVLIGRTGLLIGGALVALTAFGAIMNRGTRALIEWEAANGPLPRDHALKCLDGNRLNTDPANWACIPRALLPRLAGRWRRAYDTAPPELRPTLLAIATLEHAAREARRNRQETPPCTRS
jgi:hypothetical protein